VGFSAFSLSPGATPRGNRASAALRALSDFPDQNRRLAANPGLLPTAVEEMLRWSSPVTYFRRTATEDTELRGKQIRRGDWVAMFYGSPNRDEDVFDEPDRFDIGATPTRTSRSCRWSALLSRRGPCSLELRVPLRGVALAIPGDRRER